MKNMIKGLWMLMIMAVGMVALPASSWAFRGEEKIANPDMIRQAEKGMGPVQVMVLLKGYEEMIHNLANQEPVKSIQLKSLQIQRAVIKQMTPQMGDVGLELDNLPIFSATLTLDGIKTLAGMDDVAAITEDVEMIPSTRHGIPLMKPGNFRTPASGDGVSVAIVDTGVNYRHPALGGGSFPNTKVIGGYDFGDMDQDPMDKDGHGTACAGIVGGKPTNTGDFIGGVAPNATIYALKVISSEGTIMSSAVMKAFDWCITHQNDTPNRPIMIISTSLGTPSFHSSTYCSNQVGEAVTAAVTARGISIFVSSGNEAQTNGISYSSCLRDTISVGAVYDENFGKVSFRNCQESETRPDLVTCYSNSAPILDLLAPSHKAYTTGTPQDAYRSDFGGTSAACPYAAGAAALIQSYHKSKTGKFLSPDRLRQIMKQSGDPIRDSKSGIVTPRVNIERAILSLNIPDPGGRTDDRSPLDELRDLLRDSRKQ